MIDGNSIISHSTAQISCDLAGETAMLHLADGVYYGLDHVGAFIWNLLAAPSTFQAVCDAVMNEYDVGLEQCRRDVHALLHDLRAHGLIEVTDNEPAR